MAGVHNMLFGRDASFKFEVTLSATTLNYDLRAAALTAGWNGTLPLDARVTVASGVVVGSSSTGAYAFRTGVSFPAGSKLSLINNGYIVGCGGNGGNGAGHPYPVSTAGGAGGPALLAQAAITITNNGVIGGGGGGGGGGNYDSWEDDGTHVSYGSGGGGGGAGYSAGSGGTGLAPGINGSGGGLTTGGAAGRSSKNVYAGAGGSLGSAGGYGGGTANGGAGGGAVVGNAYITWAAAGTRLGGIS